MAHTPPGRTRERIFRFVRERLHDGHPPTVREVQREFGFRAVESARAQLEALVAEGRLAKMPGRSRGYRLPAPHARTSHVPVLGRVAAGPLTEAIEEADGFVAVAAKSPRDEMFALRVAGDSMTGAAILDGDLVIVRRQDRARNGQVVVARVRGEATVKTLRLVRGRVELHPANPDFERIVFDGRNGPDPEDVEILGVVVEVRRSLEGRR